MVKPLDTDTFRVEAQRRLIDTYTLLQLLGLRSRDTIRKRVEAGTLPRPVFQSTHVTLWDRDAIEFPTGKEG